jgi:WhiB family redox-sensing transcriptional regulator
MTAAEWSDGAAGPLLALFADIALPPTREELRWMDRASCQETDPEAFFPEKGGCTRDAKRVCMACEVRSECLDYALDRDEKFGIWGGLSERQRKAIRRTRRDEAA